MIQRRIDTPNLTPDTNSSGSGANGVGQDELNLAGIDDEPLGVTGSGNLGISSDGRGGLPWLLVLGGIAAVFAVAGIAGRFAWGYGLGGLSHPARLWEKTQRLARLSNTAAQLNETPREFATRISHAVPGTDAAGYLAARYERDRFGRDAITEQETERLDAAWVSVRGAMLRRILRLKPRS